MNTYPNQRVVTIFKEPCEKEFLQIKNEDWQAAARNISTYGTFKFYLYLAANRDGYPLALSPVAVENAIGISDSTYRRAFKELEELGYIEHKGGNNYWFNTYII